MSAHHCHAIGCTTRCKPEFLMCPKHWFMVPRRLQVRVYATYRPGQCDDKKPSREWHEAADAAILAVAEKEGKRAEYDAHQARQKELVRRVLDGVKKELES